MAPEALPSAPELDKLMKASVKDEATAAELARRVAAKRNIPPHNPEAECAADAYPLERVWPRHLLDMLPWRDLLKARPALLRHVLAPL